ncbi:hypothetical protein SAMN02745243_02538 [Hespellia stercorisuis DSM 15480]|uniref:Uncharacterized protein n=1 Tax=Hespellia stercorisuis DSM 15480 TaxID=1121950 RepID=A0A1M6QWG6_9FIRM|nr:hypothetical protein SAMN02745243_02538 [Hespellia stercorisuis DSM 15480]
MHICLSKSYFRHFTGFADLLNKQVINTYVKKPPCTCTSWYTCLCSRSSYSFFFLMYSYVFPLSFLFHTFLIGLICFELYSGICRLSTLYFKKEACLQDYPPAAGRFIDKFPSAAVRTPRSVFISWDIRRNFPGYKKPLYQITI